jgi:hypothetical protein
MSNTTKEQTKLDGHQSLKASFNDVDASLTVNGFLVGAVGRKVEVTYPDAVTEQFAFSENGTALYTIEIIYTDGTKASLLSAERIS